MSEWFQTAFGKDYLNLYAHRDDSEAARVVDLILENTAVGPGARVLDAPCGAGRHLRAFEARGIKAFGFDLSPALLAQAKADGAPPLTLVRADLRALPFREESFDLVVNLFSSLGYFDTDEMNLSVLCNIVKLCRRGQWVVIDFMNSDFVRANLEAESSRVMPDGTAVRDRRWIGGTPERVNKQTAVRFPDGRDRTFDESVRLFSPDELKQALDRCGVNIEKEFGSYEGDRFTTSSKRSILMGRRQI